MTFEKRGPERNQMALRWVVVTLLDQFARNDSRQQHLSIEELTDQVPATISFAPSSQQDRGQHSHFRDYSKGTEISSSARPTATEAKAHLLQDNPIRPVSNLLLRSEPVLPEEPALGGANVCHVSPC